MKHMNTTEHTGWQDDIVSTLCGSCDCVLEADTWEDLKEHRVRRLPISFSNLPEAAKIWGGLLAMEAGIQDCVRSGRLWSREADVQKEDAIESIGRYVALYLSLLGLLVSEVKKRREKECGELIQQLELLMRWKCCMLSFENELLIPPCHPIELAARVLAEYPREKGDGELVNAIKQVRRRAQARYQIALSDQVFLINRSEENHKYNWARSIRRAGSLTKISSIRFIEKAAHFMDVNQKKEVRMACVGEVQEPKLVKEYFQGKGCRVELFELKRRIVEDGRLLFGVDSEEERLREDDKRSFNLLLLSDLQALFKQFDIVLFMDEGCFYSAGQARKTSEEKSVLEQLEWLRRMAEGTRQTDKRLRWYLDEFDIVGKWLNGLNTDETAELQFDEKLFQGIHNAMVPGCDVYLYISQGRQVGDIDLYERNVCNDENYEGRSMAVYKVPCDRQESDALIESVETLMKAVPEEILVDVWKLVKGVSEEYQASFIKKLEGLHWTEAVDILKNTFLTVNVCEVHEQKGVMFGLKTDLGLADSENVMKKLTGFLGELLEEGFKEGGTACVSGYIKRLVGNAVVSRGNSVRDILLGYLLKKGYFDGRVVWEIQPKTVEGLKRTETLSDGLFEARRTAYSAMSNLEKYQLRDYDRREVFLFSEFRGTYCGKISARSFLGLIQSIHQVCAELGYEKSSLFGYSDIRGDKIKWVR